MYECVCVCTVDVDAAADVSVSVNLKQLRQDIFIVHYICTVNVDGDVDGARLVARGSTQPTQRSFHRVYCRHEHAHTAHHTHTHVSNMACVELCGVVCVVVAVAAAAYNMLITVCSVRIFSYYYIMSDGCVACLRACVRECGPL